MKYKIACIILIAFIIFTNPSMAFDNKNEHYNINKNRVTIVVNGKVLNTYDEIQKIDTPAFIYNDRTLLPLRKMFGIFNIEPVWNKSDRSITAEGNGKKIWLQIDNKKVKVDGEEIEIDVPAKIINNRTYVPVRFISEVMGIEPVWDANNRRVIIDIAKETMELKDLNVSFKYDRSLSLDKPVKIRNSIYQIKLMGTPNQVIYVAKYGSNTNETLLKISESLSLQPEDFTEISVEDSSNIFFIEYEDRIEKNKIKIYIIPKDNFTLVWYFMNIDTNLSHEIVKSM